jgi:DNA-directed RNA polymerase subunit D
MEKIENEKNSLKFTTKINISLANAIRRSVSDIKILAIEECEVYKNDGAFYDEILAHRLGLIPLKNKKVKEGDFIEFKFKAKGEEGGKEILSGELGDDVIYKDIPLVYLDKGQKIEIVAKAKQGTAKEHAKFSPGLVFYKNMPQIVISKEGESKIEIAERFPEVFEFKDKLKVKDASKCDLDEEDFKDIKGVTISFNNEILFEVESWGQISSKKIIEESCNVLKENLKEIRKTL